MLKGERDPGSKGKTRKLKALAFIGIAGFIISIASVGTCIGAFDRSPTGWFPDGFPTDALALLAILGAAIGIGCILAAVIYLLTNKPVD